MNAVEVPIENVRYESDLQPRTAIDQTTVEDYEQAMRGGDRFPPCKVVFDGFWYWLYGGFHRYLARLRGGFDTLSCEVVEGTLDDARWLALAENIDLDRVGLRRTNLDKRRAVEMALRLQPGRSDRAIAEHCGVSYQTVANVRAESLSKVDSQPTARTGLDGRTINTSNIGKRSAPEPSDVPAAEVVVESMPPPLPRYPHSDRLRRWLEMVAGETMHIHVEDGGIAGLLKSRNEWDPVAVREFILPMLDELEEVIIEYRKEIRNAFESR